MNEEVKKYVKVLLNLFKIDGKPAGEVATDGQLEIFWAIISKKYNRVQVISSTQYGKSLFVAFGCIILSCIEGELISIVAPTNEKAKIIMRYYIDHLGDAEVFYEKLEKESSIEKLQMETTKDRIVLKNKGGIFTMSVQAGNTQRGFQAAMGEGSKIVIQDESALIPDATEATIFRMIAGKKDGIYIKIGNPFYRNHFYTSSKDLNYHQIFIDYKRGIAEGRYDAKFIEEARKKPFFDVLFACIFPPADQINDKGYVRLFLDELIDGAQQVVEPFGEKRLGVDVAEGGGDFNSFVLKYPNYAMCVGKFQLENTMDTAGLVIRAMKEYEVFDQNIFCDIIGVGKGLYDRLTEQRYQPVGVKFSEKASDETQFSNLRAECYWNLYKWLSEGGNLEPSEDWEQLRWIKYKVDSSGRIQIMSKDDMRHEGYSSPDVVDSLALTFARRSVVNQSREERRRDKDLLKNFDFYKQAQGQYFTGSRYLRK